MATLNLQRQPMSVVPDKYYNAASAQEDWYGSKSNSRFIPAIYSKKVLRKFLNETVFQDICNRDYEGEIKKFGDSVHIRKTPDVITAPYVIGTDIVYDVPDKDAVELNVNQSLYSAFRVDDVDRAQSDLDLVNLFSKNTKKEINIEVDLDVLEYMSTGAAAENAGATAGKISGDLNLGATGAPIVITGITAGDDALQVILDLNQALTENAVDEIGRWVVLPAWFCNKLKSGDLKRADVTGDQTGTIRTGLIGEIDGMKVYRNNHLHTATDGATTGTFIIAGTNEACTFAAQIDKSDTLKIEKQFGEFWRTLFVWGRLITQPQALAVGYVSPAAVA